MMCISLFFSSYILFYSEPEWYIPMVDQSHHKVSMVDQSHHKVPMVDISHQLHQIPIFGEDPPSNFSCGGSLPHPLQAKSGDKY